MDFDEYDYLEKTVENPEPPKEKESANGDAVKSEERDRSRGSKHRNEDADRDADHHRSSKRPRSEDEPRDRDRDRHRERESRSDRSEKDRHRSSRELRDKDWEERNGKEKDRERDRERERDRDRDRDREREKERERERSRRSRSRSERHRSERDKDVEPVREREKSRDREFREKEREREREIRDRDRDSRRYKEKKEEVAEPEADPERDQRTVFAYQICLKADERDVYEFFSRAGKVRDVRLIMDRNSRRSKGVGYIEFYDAMSVPMAIALSGQPLLGQPVMVKPSEAEKNLVQSNTAVGGAGGLIGPYSGGARRLYVGNLHFNITEDQLRQVFEPFGPVELVQLPLDPETGQCKGFGFVQFARLEDARAAQSLNGQLDIAGRIIKVSAVSDQVGMQDVGANAGDFDDDDGGGLALNARSRAILMQKLDRSGATSITGSLGTAAVNGPPLTVPTAPLLGIAPAVTPLLPALGGQAAVLSALSNPSLPILPLPTAPVDTIGVPSECLLLKNMFDPENETEPDFDLDIKEDVQDECSKFGSVKHIFVDKNSAGFVYLRFENVTSAMSAQRALHGRWFAGKMITATYMLPQNYEAKFPESK
ncbi:uncharacterized protein LOC131237182 [Magnolia sinica]|uniref:uncharacterized protein LOC131237182 n=1 Tax=Magnolia sinica TaxID=86752 RepID=UPI00265903C1|nr:uncharacterized protein LOC131237182 [Magnolia sinica]